MEDFKQHARDALQAAIDKATSQAELARRVSEEAGRPIETGHVYYWLNSGSVPTDVAVAIEALFEVKRQDLRPSDYWRHWPDLPAPEAAEAGQAG